MSLMAGFMSAYTDHASQSAFIRSKLIRPRYAMKY